MEKVYGKQYLEEFKIEAVKRVPERGHPATEVAVGLGREFTQPVPVGKTLRRATGRVTEV